MKNDGNVAVEAEETRHVKDKPESDTLKSEEQDEHHNTEVVAGTNAPEEEESTRLIQQPIIVLRQFIRKIRRALLQTVQKKETEFDTEIVADTEGVDDINASEKEHIETSAE